MHFDRQLQRGYLAMISLAVLGVSFIAMPKVTENKASSASAELAVKACKMHRKSSWKLASTPIDIEHLLIRKALICGA